jgi:hypothetical protein
MGKNNGKQGTVRPIRPEFTTQAAQLTITAYIDRPPGLQCTGDLLTAIRLLTAGLALVGNSVEQASKPPEGQADPVDKKRKYLGPREG